MPTWKLYLLVLFTSQLVGSVGDLVGSRCTRVVFVGSSTRMLIGSACFGAMLVLTALVAAELGSVTGSDGRPLVRVVYLFTNPVLICQNGCAEDNCCATVTAAEPALQLIRM